eukprot:2171687-Alexandrium_andersonii.AAC.1
MQHVLVNTENVPFSWGMRIPLGKVPASYDCWMSSLPDSASCISCFDNRAEIYPCCQFDQSPERE